MSESRKAQKGSSAQCLEKKTCENLTLHDWMTVFQFVDEHPSMSQQAIVKYFESKVVGALIFIQATLSQKLKTQMHAKLCQQMESLCIKHESFDDSLGLAKHLWQY